jgi:dTDP-4-dehydrorhamnose reductase
MGLIIMFNILVTGSNGQLGSEIRAVHSNYNYNFFFTDVSELDITIKDNIKTFIKNYRINVIINCAAYTAVDKAEEDKLLANRVNHLAVKYLSEVAKEMNIQLIHISTDYVFDGKNYRPYQEDDKTDPQSIYGETKLDAENVLLHINPKNSIIIRTSWIYSSFGANFVKTMLRLGEQKDKLGIIYDQIGTPTYAKDLAKTILEILPKIKNSSVEIYHYSNEGVASWYDFAKEIMQISKIDCKIEAIETKDYPTPAKRPYYSVLNKAKIKKQFNLNIPFWKDSLVICLREIGEKI